jgi:hypothetical protein
MGFILKQNKAISISVMLEMIREFKIMIRESEPKTWECQRLCQGLVYSVICFCASLRGSEGLLLDLKTLKKNWENGNYSQEEGLSKSNPPHVIVPLRGRFKGEAGERCHLMPLANVTASGIQIRATINILLAVRQEMNQVSSSWAFVNELGNKMTFSDMNEIVLDVLEAVKEKDRERNFLDLDNFDIREDFSINRSFRRGSETHALNQKIPEPVINAQNRWKKIEAAKGRKAKFSMMENYADIALLIPTMTRYSAML